MPLLFTIAVVIGVLAGSPGRIPSTFGVRTKIGVSGFSVSGFRRPASDHRRTTGFLIGSGVAADLLDRRMPEVLAAVTPNR